MLFHVTATHTPDNCPLYDPERQAAVHEAAAKMDDLAKELGVTVHFNVTGAPNHVYYVLLDANDFASVQQFLAAVPIKQEFTITPVVSLRQAAATLLPEQPAQR